MIGSFFRVLFFALLGLAGSWGAFLFLPGMSFSTDRRDQVWYSAAFPAASHLPGGSPGTAFPTLLGTVLPGSTDTVRNVQALLARRLEVSKRLLPFWLV